jgi:hypothetical protein
MVLFDDDILCWVAFQHASSMRKDILARDSPFLVRMQTALRPAKGSSREHSVPSAPQAHGQGAVAAGRSDGAVERKFARAVHLRLLGHAPADAARLHEAPQLRLDVARLLPVAPGRGTAQTPHPWRLSSTGRMITVLEADVRSKCHAVSSGQEGANAG